MLHEFDQWVALNKPTLKSKGMSVEFTRPETISDKCSAYLDVGTSTHLARVTLWDSGECDMEILDSESEETVLFDHRVFQKPEDVAVALDAFLKQL